MFTHRVASFLLALALLTTATSSRAEAGPRRLAVLEFRGTDIEPHTLTIVADSARGGALKSGSRQRLLVMPRASTTGHVVCEDFACEVDAALKHGADLVVSGEVVKLDGVLLATLTLHDPHGGSLLGMASAEGTTPLALAGSVEEKAQTMLEGVLRADESTQTSTPTNVWTRHGLFTSVSGSMGMMWLNWDDDSSSISGAGVGVQGKLGYGIGMLSIFVELNYEATMSASEEGIATLRLDELSLDFMTVGAGLALVSDVGYISASWLFDATATGTGYIGRDRYTLEASGHGARLDAVFLFRSPSGWGAGLGPYFQWITMPTDKEEEVSLTGYSYGLNLNASFY